MHCGKLFVHSFEETSFTFNILIIVIDFGLFLVLTSAKKSMNYRFIVEWTHWKVTLEILSKDTML